ncbi:cysteine-rich CWC family protein [Rhodoferax sp.]|uniref:cysteine-rich CWC family protein n=1 Tax=Rhodoferax sp. TaxID=50421 RepID=UPI0027594852|nr:cysteine-rich CWC family protein [Rhodoferax sp.]
MPSTFTDPRLCPLCGQLNQCAMEIEKQTGVPQSACWCCTATISAELLSQIPEGARNQACVCAACAAKSAVGALA